MAITSSDQWSCSENVAPTWPRVETKERRMWGKGAEEARPLEQRVAGGSGRQEAPLIHGQDGSVGT